MKKGHAMSRTRTSLALTILMLALGAASLAEAQNMPPRGFVNVNFAAQTGSRDFNEAITFPLNQEEATFLGTHPIEEGGLFDFSGGVRVWRNLAAGIGFSQFENTTDVTLAGSVPHPDFFNTPRSATVTVPGMVHEETTVNLMAVYFVPIAPGFDLALSIGPSFISVTQEMVSAVQVTEQGPPFTAVNTAATTVSLEESIVGVNIGADFTYMFTPYVGGGFFMRYAGGSADFTSPSGVPISLDVGGFQIGGGARIRF
jgi:hypothetical protein